MRLNVAIIGGGPSGLMVAEKLAGAGFSVTVYERKPSLARKFLLAGHGGLNLTHSEGLDDFITRYGPAAERLRPVIENFPPSALRAWCEELGEPTFIGSSGRVFPKSFKAAPLLRKWYGRLEKLGVKFVLRRLWTGWDINGHLVFNGPDGTKETVLADITVLALGGASWPRLGADGSWVDILRAQNIPVTPLRPANCGFVVAWSDIFHTRYAGQPVKPVTLSFAGKTQQGEMMITSKGVEGGIIYAFSAAIREEIDKNGAATVMLDLRPDIAEQTLAQHFSEQRGALSFSNTLKKTGKLSDVAAGLVREIGGKEAQTLSPSALAALVKNLPLRMDETFSMDRAISTAGGVSLAALDEYFMLKDKPGTYVIGEMVDWEAPTGGYLLQASFSMAVWTAQRIQNLHNRQ
jgi:uncharacterized flavoprotein (TIGR03862 family)